MAPLRDMEMRARRTGCCCLIYGVRPLSICDWKECPCGVLTLESAMLRGKGKELYREPARVYVKLRKEREGRKWEGRPYHDHSDVAQAAMALVLT